MTRNNSACGVGVAYNAKLAGIRLLGGSVIYDSTEARALVDVYSNSWGPSDEGMVVEGPGPLTAYVLRHGVTHVRTNIV